jgi:hypothetical protein
VIALSFGRWCAAVRDRELQTPLPKRQLNVQDRKMRRTQLAVQSRVDERGTAKSKKQAAADAGWRIVSQ